MDFARGVVSYIQLQQYIRLVWALDTQPYHTYLMYPNCPQVLDDVLSQKIQDPSIELSESKAVALIMRLIEMDGF